jgi:hypothetical protein
MKNIIVKNIAKELNIDVTKAIEDCSFFIS